MIIINQGAAHIADFLLNHFGKDGFAFVIDEGGKLIYSNAPLNQPANIEQLVLEKYMVPRSRCLVSPKKGTLTFKLKLLLLEGIQAFHLTTRYTPSTPVCPAISLIHTLVVNWHTRCNVDPLRTKSLRISFCKEPTSYNLCSTATTPHQSRDEPLFDSLRCFAEHGEDMPDELRKLIARSKTSDKALNALTNEVSKNRLFKSLAGTTQAIDIIHGGVKANALPEQAYALVNHRVAVTRFGSYLARLS